MLDIPKQPLKVLVIGSGGREHALCWKLAQSPLVEQIFCAPGNGGTATESKTKNIPIEVSDFAKLVQFCNNENIDFTVVGPDNPLGDGIVDYFLDNKLKIFGPTKAAARLEWSKSYAKEFMGRNHIPTAKFKVCNAYDEALQVIQNDPWARVVKADGLAFGKGVYVCDDQTEAEQAIKEIFQDNKFGEAGKSVVLEERLNGEEISLFLLCDGKTFLPMAASQDNKRRFENDRGPNTGGMGAISPPAIYEKYRNVIDKTIVQPLLEAIRKEGLNYQGILYLGLLLDESGDGSAAQPKVLEINARFGDPETEAVLPRLESDLLPALWACTEGKLKDINLEWKKEASCCVMAVSKTYPEQSAKGQPITFAKKDDHSGKINVFHFGTRLVNNQIVTAGGRIFGVTALSADLESAAKKAYAYLADSHFENMDYRKDIVRTKSGISTRKQ